MAIITLKFPITYVKPDSVTTLKPEGDTVTVVTVEPHRVKARDLRNLPPGAFADNQGNPNALAPVMIALCCDLPLSAAEEMDLEDVMEVMKVMPNLLPGFSGTGEKSSGESPQPSTSPQT